MYYNLYSEELKDERLEVVSEETIDDTKYILLKLHTQCNNPCPKCHSNNTIRYGARKRKIEMSLFAHFKTDITLEFSRFRCKNCLAIFNDDSALTSSGESISRSTKFAVLQEFNELSGMFKSWKKKIINSFIRFGERKLHNGYIEGIINHIKVIKRVSYGYTNFHHLRSRIMYIINNDVVLTEVDTTIIRRKSRKKNK